MRKAKTGASLATAYRYKKKGHDVTTNGKIDEKKVQKIYDAKRNQESKSKPSADGKYWDTEFRKERALKLIREREIAEGVFVRKDEVIEIVVKRETEIKRTIMALGRRIAPKLFKQKIPTIQRIITDAHAAAFNSLAKKL